MAAANVHQIMAPFPGTPGVEQSALFKSDDEQEREMTAREPEGCFYWPAVGSSEMFPGRYGGGAGGEKNTPTKILADSGRGRSKKRQKGGERGQWDGGALLMGISV